VVVKRRDPQMLDRYSYVRNNPLKYVDPSGLSMVIVCGTTQACGGKGVDLGTIDTFFWFAMNYWVNHEGMSAEGALAAWGGLRSGIGAGLSSADQLNRFGIAFMSTMEDEARFVELVLGDTLPYSLVLDDPTDEYAEDLQELVMSAPGYDPVDTLVGFSLGGFVVAKFLAEHDPQSVTGALMIEPGFNAPFLYNPIGNASQLPGVNLVTLNGARPQFELIPGVWIDAGGSIPGAANLRATNGRGHCNHANTGDVNADMMTVHMAMSAMW
jgi:hypothetical protein